MQPASSAGKREQGPIGFGLASYWLKKWREFCQPITERSKAKPKQTCTFDTQLKTALKCFIFYGLERSFVSKRIF